MGAIELECSPWLEDNQWVLDVIEKDTILEDFTPALTAMGHEVRPQPFDSGLNGIRRIPNGYEGGADPRRSGIPLGD
mgnify:CR=1 FL=1